MVATKGVPIKKNLVILVQFMAIVHCRRCSDVEVACNLVGARTICVSIN
jgi:hypothetical protein